MSIFSKEDVVQIKLGGPIRRYRVAAGQRLRTTKEEAQLVVGLFDHVPHDPAGKQTGKRCSRNRSPRQKLRKGCFVSGLTRYLHGAYSRVEYEAFSSEVKVLGYWKTKIARWMKSIGDARCIASACRERGWKPDYPFQLDAVRSFRVGNDVHRGVRITQRPEGYRIRLWPIEFAFGDHKPPRSNQDEEDTASFADNQGEPINWVVSFTTDHSTDPDSNEPFDMDSSWKGSSYHLSLEACENGDFIVSLPRRLPGRRWIYRALFPELGYWVMDKFLRDMGFVPELVSNPTPSLGNQIYRWRPDFSIGVSEDAYTVQWSDEYGDFLTALSYDLVEF